MTICRHCGGGIVPDQYASSGWAHEHNGRLLNRCQQGSTYGNDAEPLVEAEIYRDHQWQPVSDQGGWICFACGSTRADRFSEPDGMCPGRRGLVETSHTSSSGPNPSDKGSER